MIPAVLFSVEGYCLVPYKHCIFTLNLNYLVVGAWAFTDVQLRSGNLSFSGLGRSRGRCG